MGWFGKKFKCDACGAKFKTESELAEHGKTHAEGAAKHGEHGGHEHYECDVCKEFFHTPAELKAHKKQFH